MFVKWERVKTCDTYAVILTEIFKKCDVYLSFFLSAPYYIALIACVADDIYWDKHQRGIAWLFGKVAFVPAEKSQSEEEGVTAVFLHAHLCGAVEAFKGGVKVGFIKKCSYAVVFELVLGDISHKVLFVLDSEYFCVTSGNCPLGRYFHDTEVTSACKLVLKLSKVGGHKLHGVLCDTEVQKRISQAEIKELSFPYAHFCDGLIVALCHFAKKRAVKLGGGDNLFWLVGSFCKLHT